MSLRLLTNTVILLLFVARIFTAQQAFAIAGTDQVASPGKPVTLEEAAQYLWPVGVLEFINDPARTTGWNSWFSGTSSHVNNYLYRVKSTADANRLIAKFAQISVPKQQLVLAFGMGPTSVGIGQVVPEDGENGAMFDIGSQKKLDDWFYQQASNRGINTITKQPPQVQPPTLHLYVHNRAIDLTKLEIPPWVEVSAAYEPPVGYVERLRSSGLPDDRFVPELAATRATVGKIMASRTPRKKSEGETADKRNSLRHAIQAFNQMAADDLIGCEQSPLTELEVVAAIRMWQREKESPVTDELLQAFKRIAETVELPEGAEFEVLREIDPGQEFVFVGWWVRIQLPKSDGGSYSFPIRSRVMRSVSIEQKLEEVGLSLDKWPRELPAGRWRLDEYHQELKRRVDMMQKKITDPPTVTK